MANVEAMATQKKNQDFLFYSTILFVQQFCWASRMRVEPVAK
jgi:hypothetical protein